MTPAEIAETLHNGNIAQARGEIIWREGVIDAYEIATTTIEVVEHLATLMTREGFPDYQAALHRVKRCLEGA